MTEEVDASIGVFIDTSAALAELKNLQRQLATFHASMAKNSQAAILAQRGLQTNLLNSINATGKFSAQMVNVKSSTESFTHALEANKLTMREYFRYAGGSSRTFGKLFKAEFDTIGKVAQDRVKKMQTQYIKMGRETNGAIKAMAITPHTLNMKDYATQTAIAAQKQAIFTQTVRQGSTSLLNFGKNTQWAGRQLMVGFSVPLLYIGALASKTFMDLEAQAVRFKRVYGDMFTTSSDTEKALKEIQHLAEGFTKYGVAVSKTMEMAATAAAMGKTGADLTAQVAEATRLAVLGGVEQADALNTTISLTNAFGVATADLTSKVDFLNSVENQTILSIEDLTIAIPKAGPVVKQLGGDVEDLAFFLTAMREGGINASEGANALKSGLAALINPSAKATKMLGALGVNVNGIVQGNAGNIKNTVLEFAKALDTLAPLDRSRAIEQMFGKFQFARLSTLFQNITKDGSQASKVLELAGKSVEELAILSEREMKTVENAVGVDFRESLEKLKLSIAPIGKVFLQAVTPVVKAVSGLVNHFNNLGEGSKKFVIVMTAIVGVIGPALLMTFGLLANGTANILKLFIAMRGGILKIGGGSKVLAEQTRYLNQEQLEGATIAASLNQAHTQLTQKFEFETAAVNMLRTAYIQATLAAEAFALANPGMMMASGVAKAAKGASVAKATTASKTPFTGTITAGRGKKNKRYAEGIAMVPGSGTGDTVPALLTPGEAVVPSDVMKNPMAKPLIQGLIDGRLRGFNSGADDVANPTKVRKEVKGGLEFAHIGDSKTTPISDILQMKNVQSNPSMMDKLMVQKLLQAELKVPEVARLYGSLGIMLGGGVNNQMDKGIGVSKDLLINEWKKVGLDKWRTTEDLNSKYSFRDHPDLAKIDALILEGLNNTKGSHIKDSRVSEIFNSIGGVAGMEKSPVYSQMKGLRDSKTQVTLGTGISGDVSGAINRLVEKNILQSGEVILGDSGQIKSIRGQLFGKASSNLGRGSRGSGRQSLSASEAVFKRYLEKSVISASSDVSRNLALDASDKEIRNSKYKNSPVQVYTDPHAGTESASRFPGSSFREFSRLGGVRFNADGQQVMVKPVRNLDTAQAEVHGTQMAQKVFGLDTPKQKIVVSSDPAGRKFFAIESPFEQRFSNMQASAFTEDQAVRQLLAAGYRADSDLKTANLSGNMLVDVGAAGVFESASGNREYSSKLRSVKDQIMYSLGGDSKGFGTGTNRDFMRNTQGLFAKMGREKFSNLMRSENARAVESLSQFTNTIPKESSYRAPAERQLSRARESLSVDWGNVWDLSAGTLITKNESIQNKKTGKVTKPKTGPKPKGAKPSSGSQMDNRKTVVPKTHRVVQDPVRKAPAVIMRSHADAPPAESSSPLGKPKTPFSQRMGMASGALGGLGMASMMTGQSEMLTGGLFGVSALMAIIPMITTVTAGVVAALLVVGAGLLMYQKIQKNSAEKQAKYVESISATTEKMKKIGELTDKIGASQIMEERRRKGNFQDYNQISRDGRGFGAGFLDSEVGKSINTGVISNIEKSGTKSAAKQLSLQLAAYISDGIISAEQANSIAGQIGTNLGDQTFTANVEGELRMLVGPDGEDILRDPIKVRVNLITESQRASKTLVSGKDFGTTEASLVAAYGVRNVELAKAQADAVFMIKQKQIDLLETELLNTKNKERQLTIQKEILGLAEDQTLEAKTMNEQVANSLNLAMKQYVTARSGKKGLLNAGAKKEAAYFNSLKSTVTDRYAGTLFASMGKKVQGNLSKLSDQGFAWQKSQFTEAGFKSKDQAQAFEVKMNILMGSGEVNPEQAKGMMDLFAGKLNQLNTTLNVGIKTHGAVKVSELAQMLGGIENKKMSRQLVMDLVQKNPQELDKAAKAIALLQSMPYEINFEVAIAGLTKDGNAGLTKLAEDLETVYEMESPVTKEIITKLKTENPDNKAIQNLDVLMAQYRDFNALPDTFKKEAIARFLSIYSVKFADDIARKEYMRKYAKEKGQDAASRASGDAKSWVQQEVQERVYRDLTIGKDGRALTGEEQSAKLSAMETRTITGDLAKGETSKTTSGGNAGDSGQRDTTLDDLLRRLKLTRDASINAQGGVKELMRVLGQKKDIKMFTGMSQQLGKQEREFIDFIGGMDNATQAGYLNTEKLAKGIVKLNDRGWAAARGYKEAILGEYDEATNAQTRAIKVQSQAFTRLVSTGLSAEDALSMVSDASFSLALSVAPTSVELQTLIEDFLRLKKAAEDAAKAMLNPQEAFDAQATIMDKFLSLSKQVIEQANAKPILDAQNKISGQQKIVDSAQAEVKVVNDIIDAIQTDIADKQRSLEIGITREIQKFQNDIEAIQEEIQKNFSDPIDKITSESGALSHDLSLIDRAAEAVNEKYDKQAEALNRIATINEEIASQQQKQLGLADALTQGDISAAAAAAQEMRSASAGYASGRSSGVLSASRAAEIGALKNSAGQTRIQIEEAIYQKSEQIYALERAKELAQQRIVFIEENNIKPLNEAKVLVEAEILALEDKIYAIKFTNGGLDGVSLLAAEAKLKATQDQLDKDNLAYTKAIEFRDAELAKIALLEADWTAIQASIAQATLDTINWATELGKAKVLADALALSISKIVIPIIPTGELSVGNKANMYDPFDPTHLGSYSMGVSSIGAIGAPALRAMGYWANGGLIPKGTDTVPAMLTPGEFVVNRSSTKLFGPLLSMLNGSGSSSMIGGSNLSPARYTTPGRGQDSGQGVAVSTSVNNSSSAVYNYSIGITLNGSNMKPKDIAREVMDEIKYVDSQRIRSKV